MNKIVFDACSLIYITKISMKEIITKTFSNIMITSTVKKEILCDLQKFTEAKVLKANIETKKIIERDLKASRITKSLGLGESEAINLAKNEKALLITDDILAINQALSWEIIVKTSELLLLLLLEKKVITYNEFKGKLNELNMIKTLKPKVLEIVLKEAEKFK